MGNTPTTLEVLASATIAVPPARNRSHRRWSSGLADTTSGPPARAVTLYLALVLVLAGLTVGGASAGLRALLVVLTGLMSLATLVAASVERRARRGPTWSTIQQDPFPAFAGALVMFLIPRLLGVSWSGTGVSLDPHHWMVGLAAATFGALGFSILFRNVAPGRAFDTVCLCGIGALATGLSAWAVAEGLFQNDVVRQGPSVDRLVPVVLDVFVVGLGLCARHRWGRARAGFSLLLLAWTVVLVADISELVATLTGGRTDDGWAGVTWILVFGLFGAAALHPSTTQAAEVAAGPLARLPRSQVALLAGAVLLGPAIMSFWPDDDRVPVLVMTVSAALSLFVVLNLVRLVQGRAVFEHRAHHDELTGLANRTLFEERVSAAIVQAQRTNGCSAVLFLDLDRFKNVNDSLGHAVGNLLLQAVARRLHGATRTEDTVARLGGDEFAVLLPDVTDPEEATRTAARILDHFGDPFTLSGHRVFASPSIGISVFPGDGDDADGLLENADAAMYRAKERGRRTFCTYERSMNVHAHERLALESRLHTAVERNELRMHYQPKVRLPSGRMTGMEALLRWEHPDLGLLEPSHFISIAEESGLIVPIGEWALEEACRQNQAWCEAGLQPLVVAVNLSLRQFQQQRIEDVTARVLRSTGLDPELLELEVTESLALQDIDAVQRTLSDVRAMGVKCSIDDFGTGYSGLSHLTRLPVDKLKIDKSFVATIDADRRAPIVVAVVALAHGLGLEVVAEGVESLAELERLQELGCDEMQGYLFSAPVPAHEFEELLVRESIRPVFRRVVDRVQRRPL